MLNLDMATAMFIYVLLGYGCTILLTLAWLENHNHFAGTNLFVTGLALQSCGMTLLILRGSLPPLLTVVLANTLILCALIALLSGLAHFVNHRIDVTKYSTYILLFISVYYFYTTTVPDIRMRIILFSLATIPIFLHNCILVFFIIDKNHKRYARPVGVVYILFAATALLRTYYVYHSGNITEYLDTQKPGTLFIAVNILLTTSLTYAIQHMINAKLAHETEMHIEAHEKTLAELDRLATYDSLTNVFNRRKLETTLSQHIAQSTRYNHPLSILLCDIDKFKSINDQYGHDVGDQAILSVIETLTKTIRSADIIGRWGGEEFVIIVPGLVLDQAILAADRLRMEVMSHHSPPPWANETLTISVGVAEYNSIETQEDLIKRADKALYRAKELGRNRVEGEIS